MATKTARKNRAPAAQPLPPYTTTPGFSAVPVSPSAPGAEALVVYAFEHSKKIEGIDAGKLRSFLEALLVSEGFRAKRGRTLLCHTSGRFTPQRVIVAGLGRRAEFDLDALRAAASAAARRAAGASARTITYTMPPAAPGATAPPGERARAIAEGCLLGTYRLRKYLTGERLSEEGSIRSGSILAAARDVPATRFSLNAAARVCAATNLARDIVNEPAIAVTPIRMATIARALASRAGIECRVHDEKALERMGMGAFLGVSRGSDQPPRFIHLVYRPRSKPVRKIALVGKGLTFDSGGLSLKTSAGMETMKLDKAGSVAVLATMLTLSEMKASVEVHGLMGMTENMPGGSAIKPGDVLRTSGGKTVEVLNTDAEGRLVLADLLSFASGLGVDEIVDLATLTGACMVALGPLSGGLFSNDDALSARLVEASRVSGEKIWRLPLYEEYGDQLRSEIADVKNTADRYGSAITAALFLREFVGPKIPWAHLDIAGPAFLEGASHPYMRRGATGMGVRLLLAYLGTYS